MGEDDLVPTNSESPVKPSATVGQELFAKVMDELDALGVTIPRAAIAVAVKHGKQALEDGVDPECVVVGCLMALRQGKGRFATDYIAEVAVIKSGHHISPREWREKVNAYKAASAGPSVAEQLVQSVYDRKRSNK